MTTRSSLLLGTLSISLGILALFAGARDYPLLLITAGGFVLARLCIHPGTRTHLQRSTDGSGRTGFALPSMAACPPERLVAARELAARVVASTGRDALPRHEVWPAASTSPRPDAAAPPGGARRVA